MTTWNFSCDSISINLITCSKKDIARSRRLLCSKATTYTSSGVVSVHRPEALVCFRDISMEGEKCSHFDSILEDMSSAYNWEPGDNEMRDDEFIESNLSKKDRDALLDGFYDIARSRSPIHCSIDLPVADIILDKKDYSLLLELYIDVLQLLDISDKNCYVPVRSAHKSAPFLDELLVDSFVQFGNSSSSSCSENLFESVIEFPGTVTIEPHGSSVIQEVCPSRISRHSGFVSSFNLRVRRGNFLMFQNAGSISSYRDGFPQVLRIDVAQLHVRLIVEKESDLSDSVEDNSRESSSVTYMKLSSKDAMLSECFESPAPSSEQKSGSYNSYVPILFRTFRKSNDGDVFMGCRIKSDSSHYGLNFCRIFLIILTTINSVMNLKNMMNLDYLFWFGTALSISTPNQWKIDLYLKCPELF
eukprot:205236_1